VKKLILITSFVSVAAFFAGFSGGLPARAQASLPTASRESVGASARKAPISRLPGDDETLVVPVLARENGEAASSSLTAPDPVLAADPAGAYDHYDVPPSATWHQIPFSRIGIGGDINLLGIGIKSAIVLNHYWDARLMGNFLSINSGNFKVEGFQVNTNFHFDSAVAALDFYPWGSVFRVSGGLLFANGNQVSVSSDIEPGTSFTLNGQTYYSAKANPATGAIPLSGTGVLGFHTNVPAFTVAGGFGKYIPRSNRHWSFPSEFGVAFTGAPSANVTVAGWACTDPHYTHCSDVGDPTNPVAIQFHKSLQAQLTKWRRDLANVTVYPLFSYSVMYSFNIR